MLILPDVDINQHMKNITPTRAGQTIDRLASEAEKAAYRQGLREVLRDIEEYKVRSGSEDRGVGEWFLPDAAELTTKIMARLEHV